MKKKKIKNSLDMQERAKKRVPGGTQLLSKRSEMFAPNQWPGYFSSASGVHVYDLDNNKYLDYEDLTQIDVITFSQEKFTPNINVDKIASS